MKVNNENKTNELKPIDPKMMARIQSLRLMDDDFMTIVFSGDNKLTEFVLKIILNRNDLTVKSSMTQQEKHNLVGRSVRLDILAVDDTGKIYNIEIQRADKGAIEKRVRYNQVMIDSHALKRNDDFSALPEVYIIFITENDLYKKGKPIYREKKSIEIEGGDDLPFDDGVHTLYVNGAYRGNDAIGKLMHDFCTADSSQMYYDEIANCVRFHKQDTQEVNTVCRIFEEYGDERAAQAREERNIEFAEELLRDGSLSQERIAAVSQISIEQVEQLAKNINTASVQCNK